MSWAFAYYLYNLIYNIVTLTTFLVWINLIPIIVTYILIQDTFYVEDKEKKFLIWKKYVKYSVIVLIISTFFAVIIPDENQLVKLFGIHISQKIYEGNTEAVNKIPSQLLDIINSIKTEEE